MCVRVGERQREIKRKGERINVWKLREQKRNVCVVSVCVWVHICVCVNV